MKTAKDNTLAIYRDFSLSPGPRYISEGNFSGEKFRKEVLEPKVKRAINDNTRLLVDLDGTAGYGTSFLEEAFGGLIRDNNYTLDEVTSHLSFKSNEEEYLIEDIKEYFGDAWKMKNG